MDTTENNQSCRDFPWAQRKSGVSLLQNPVLSRTLENKKNVVANGEATDVPAQLSELEVWRREGRSTGRGAQVAP